MDLDLDKILNEIEQHNRFESRLKKLESQPKPYSTDNIRDVVLKAESNIKNGIKSFVIFGEPQSGKTEMMIALTAKLLDLRYRFIIVLVNDNIELLNQNLGRFVEAQLNPTPVEFSEIIDKKIDVSMGQWVVFCKKNSRNLQSLLYKIEKYPDKFIIDDEADYASPNSKINKNERNAINKLIAELLGQTGFYIGVTATPARLDLNNTFNNDNTSWIFFRPHKDYTGQQQFFPPNIEDIENLPYTLKILPATGDLSSILTDAAMRFLVNVSYLNSTHESKNNYSMLIHTSGKTADHSTDYYTVERFLNILKIHNTKDQKFLDYIKKILKFAEQKFPNHKEQIITYILKTIGSSKVIIMNNKTDRDVVDYSLATDPKTPFTFAIGGNVVSRGVTFHNLLSLFFTRDSKHKIQQDTYIQRARMFGNRNKYLKFFELSIPEALFSKWHQCFVFHALSLQAIKNNQKPPIWFEDKRISAVARTSIDKSNVDMNTGEMVTAKTDKRSEIEKIVNAKSLSSLEKLEAINKEIGEEAMPKYMLEFIKKTSPAGDKSVGWYGVRSVGKEPKDPEYYSSLIRRKGAFGSTEIKKLKAENPEAVHFFMLLTNDEGFARLVYKHEGRITTIRHRR